jgi:phosphoribosylamine---glycine ligase
MKILVIGSGGREHALVWKLRQCSGVEKIWCAPGNGGIANDAECVSLEVKNVTAAADLAARVGADLTIVGPEQPLVLGIADEFSKRGLTLLGPTKRAAQLEGSKVFAKQFMERHAIPTAPPYGVFDSEVDALMALRSVDWPLVIKADGLCAGKGVLVTLSPHEAAAFVTRLMKTSEFGDAGRQVLFEEGLTGEELSYIILTDGKDFISMAPTRDHKRAFDGDEGPNTGGMGAYSTDELLPPELERQILETVVRPTLAGLKKEGTEYRGFLYFGLMLTPAGPKVLEFNCRLGDPETQAIMLRVDFNLAEACMQTARGKLASLSAKWTPGASVCVVMASEGYPGTPTIGVPITGLDDSGQRAGATVFHSATRRDQAQYYTSGGRVLGIGAKAETTVDAARKCYDTISTVSFRGSHFRTDVGRSGTEKRIAVGESGNV